MGAAPVQYVRTSDGYDIAYRITDGAGPPLLFLPLPLIDMNRVWQWFPDWMEGLAQRFRLIQFDCRGQGFSTRHLPAHATVDDFYRDVEAVIARVGTERFLIWAWAAPCHIAVKYAVSQPGRIAGLILNTCSVSNLVWKLVQMTLLPQENWDLFLRTIAPPGLSQEETRLRVRVFKDCMTQEDWHVWSRAHIASDVGAYLGRVRAPTLVLHPRKWRMLPAEESIRFAARIRDARFQLIDGNYIYGQAHQGLGAIDAFLSDLGYRSPGSHEGETPLLAGGLSSRELEVLRLLAGGRSNPQIGEALAITPSTVAKHVSSILAKTESANRVEATSYAHKHGLV
jgi:pimeloyl-ACP methyl ester carboxylesterase/DNA-binding CsgD family transcriptional regulator